MTETKSTLGVQISRQQRSGCEYVVCRVMQRQGEARHPLNATDRWDGKIFAENLVLEGYVSEYGDHVFCLFDPGYRDIYSASLGKVRRMADTLKRIEARILRDEAREPGDVFLAFCKAIGATWAVVEVENRGTMLSDSLWCFYSVSEGRNRFRLEIERAREAAVAKGERIGSGAAA